MAIEWVKLGKPSLFGIVTSMVAGLATITPGSGFVGPIGALIIGGSAGVICYVLVSFVKNTLKVDDSLDVFAVHGAGGVLGILLVSFLTDANIGGAGYADGMSASVQLNVQLIGVASVFVWSIVASLIIIVIVKALTGLRVEDSHEEEGLDISSHGETNYRQ